MRKKPDVFWRLKPPLMGNSQRYNIQWGQALKTW